MRLRLYLTLSGLLLVATVSHAKVRLPAIFSDNMVLQQQTRAVVWGKAAPGKKVTVKGSWGKSARAEAGADSCWLVRIETPAAGGPYTMTISDGQSLTLNNVLIGEVWLCSGQSNMEMPMRGYGRQPVEGALDAMLAAESSFPLRIARLPRQASMERKWDCRVDGWNLNEPDAISRASATAYYFGKILCERLHVPVGLVISDWGGTAIEPWMSEECLRALGYDLSDKEDSFAVKKESAPTVLYNAMLAPLAPFTVKGFIWYQGESNRPGNDPEFPYSRLQTAFGKMLRENFGDGSDKQPFYFVEIAPYNYSGADDLEAAYLREQQALTLDLLPNSGMVVTNDIGNPVVIHPAQKPEVGRRLALLAFQRNYGLLGEVDFSYPEFDSVKYEGTKAVLTFKTGPGGLAPLNQDIAGFEVAGSDKVFYPATARVGDRFNVELTCEQVSEIVAVRYCFRNYKVGTLTNVFGLPARPFRTDNW